MLKGIDVSWYQRDIDLSRLSLDFVIIKATGGAGEEVNPACDPIYQQAKQLGILRGIYHYYSDGYGGDDPIAEADWFVDNCLGYIHDAILVLDWEAGGNAHVRDVSKAKAWLDRVYARTGVRPIIYMSASLVHELDWSSVIAGNYGLWVAAWPWGDTPINNFAMDPNLDPNPSWDGQVNDILWQFTSAGYLDGYSARLDCDFFYGDRHTWELYAGATPTPQPEPTPQPDPTPTPDPAPESEPTPEPTPDPEPDPDPATPPTPEPPRRINLLPYIIKFLKWLLRIK